MLIICTYILLIIWYEGMTLTHIPIKGEINGATQLGLQKNL